MNVEMSSTALAVGLPLRSRSRSRVRPRNERAGPEHCDEPTATGGRDNNAGVGVPMQHQRATIELWCRVESWRIAAYAVFMVFVLFAYLVSTLVVAGVLEKGDPGCNNATADTNSTGCGPFNRNGGRFNLTYGKGFDFATENHLFENFGYSNICVYWDYSPAREYTAVLFPFFEVAMITYLTLDFFNTKLSFQAGRVSALYWRFCKIQYPITVFLCLVFRLIFVIRAYEDVKGHTFGFLCFQVGLLLIAASNTAYVVQTKQRYAGVGLGLDRPENVALVGKVYLSLLFLVSSVKLVGTAHIVKTGEAIFFYTWSTSGDPGTGILVGKLIDKCWLFLNLVVPLVVAIVRASHEEPLRIEISLPATPAVYSSVPEHDPDRDYQRTLA